MRLGGEDLSLKLCSPQNWGHEVQPSKQGYNTLFSGVVHGDAFVGVMEGVPLDQDANLEVVYGSGESVTYGEYLSSVRDLGGAKEISSLIPDPGQWHYGP